MIALKIMGLSGLLLPILIGLWAIWRRCWADAPSSECLLAAAVGTPFFLILEIVTVGNLPFSHPLWHLWWIQLLVSAGWLGIAWWNRASLTAAARQALSSLRRARHKTHWLQGAVFIIGLLTHVFSTAYGIWHAPWSCDELSYHIPQAVQPYQDGRLGPVQANIVWADSYPRGAALLFYWTLQLTHTDAGFHAVNAAFGFVFILATYVAAMRLGLGQGWSLFAAGLVPTAPLFWYLSSVGYIDLTVGGILATVLAFALPERERAWSWGSCWAAMLAAAMVMWMKFPPLLLIGFVFTLRGIAQILQWLQQRRRPDQPRPTPGPLAFIGVAFLAALVAAIPYMRTWMVYGSPVYPVRLRAGKHVLFDGPMDTKMFGRLNDRPILERYSAFWSDWYSQIHTDSQGTFGPLFLLAMPAAALACLITAVRRREPGWLLLTLAFWVVLALPEHHVPRYAVYVLLPGAVCIARVGRVLEKSELSTGWTAAIALLLLWNLHVVKFHVDRGIYWQFASHAPLFTEERNRIFLDTLTCGDEDVGPMPETRQAVYHSMKDGETLVAVIGGYHGQLYDYRYRYRVEHRPAQPWPYQFIPFDAPQFGEENAGAWYAGLLRDGIQAVIVYTGGAEDRALAAPDSNYHCVYEQMTPGWCPMRLYRCKAGS